MADEIEVAHLVTKLSLSDSGVEKSLAQLGRQMRVVQSEFNAASSKLDAYGSSEDKLRLKSENLNKQMEIQGQRVLQLKQKYEESVAAKGKDAKATEILQNRLNKAVSEYNKMDAALKSTEAELEKQVSAWNKVSGALDKVASKMESAGNTMRNAGASLTTMMTAPLAAVAGLATKASIGYETAFAGVKKTVDATEAELKGFSDEIRKMSREIPQSASAIAEVAEAAGQLGIKNEALISFTRTMSDLGVATNMASTEAATSLARLANITQMPQKNFDRLGATIVGLGNNLATTESEIVDMSLRLAGAGKQIGLTEAQILAFGGSLSSVGIEAEAGGSAFSRVMIDMAQAVATGSKDLNNFAMVAGISAQELQEKFKTDAAGALLDFIDGLGRMSAAGENTFAVLDALGLSEIRVRDALLRASGAGDLFRNSLELGTKAWEENTALTKEATTRYETTASQIEITKNKIVDAAITLGDSLKPALLAVFAALEPVIQKGTELANMFSVLDQSTQTTIIVVAAVVAALGPVLLIVGQLSMSIAALIPVVQALGSALIYLSTNPVGLAITALISTLAILTIGFVNAKVAARELAEAQSELNRIAEEGITREEIPAIQEKEKSLQDLIKSYEELIKVTNESYSTIKTDSFVGLNRAADDLGISIKELSKQAREFGVDLKFFDANGKVAATSLNNLKSVTNTYTSAVKNAQKATAAEVHELARSAAVKQQQINSTLNMIKTYNTAKQGTDAWKVAQKGLLDQFPQFATATGVNTEAIKGLILVKQREVELEWQSVQAKAAEALQEKQTAIAKQEAAITIVNGINKIAGSSGIAEGALNRMNAELARLRGEAASLQALLNMQPGDIKIPKITVPTVSTGKVAGLDLGDKSKGKGGGSKKEKTPKEKAYENKALDDAYKQMEHKKKMDQLTLESELKTLETIRAKYVKTADERMEIEERIYAVKKALGDKSLEVAMKDYERAKSLGKLNEDDEIKRLQRIRKLYADSADERERIDDMIFEATRRKVEKEKELREKTTEDVSKSLKAAYEDRLAREELDAEQKYKLEDKLLNDQIYLNKNYLEKVMKDRRYSAAEKKQIEKEITEAIRVQTNERLLLARKYAEDQKKILEDQKKDQIENINNLSKGIQDALKAKYTEEKRVAEEGIKSQIEANESWKKSQLDSIKAVYDARVSAAQKAADEEIAQITAVTNAQIEAIQARLDALNKGEQQRSRAELDAADQKKIDRLTGMIDYEHDAFNREQLTKELNKVIAEQNERHRQEQLADTKEALTKEQQELKNKLSAETQIIKDNLAIKKEMMQADYNADVERINSMYEYRKSSLNSELAAVQDTYNKMLESKNLQAEAEKMIVNNQQKDIIKLLETFGESYNKTGKTLGEEMYQGFKSQVDQIQSLISSINSQINAARSSALSAMETVSFAAGASSGGGKSSSGSSSSGIDTRQAVKVEVVNNFNTKVTSPSDIARATTQAAQKLAY
ncbi:hypothetical protein PAECIP112173_00350 [Paenibacillus sp. JJ-100]|uniref:phage tail tape measure protein n=1 Tax=Paenibacillus sp. JJ-100 TaxID=2974896 RepID=UPI0022FF8053|nr:phage tail tape measure protein [Paenibacillus sp. JJ-100]CAI6023618.1 hypothetical protein PAECIP112173_00350 [Paenibacillus sp. JJ-100]